MKAHFFREAAKKEAALGIAGGGAKVGVVGRTDTEATTAGRVGRLTVGTETPAAEAWATVARTMAGVKMTVRMTETPLYDA